MPRYFLVTQERKVRVRAEDTAEAAQIANAAFRNEIQRDDLADHQVLSPVIDTDLNVSEEI